MSTSAPLFGIGDQVYLRESAGIGFLEAVTISGIYRRPDNVGWMYTFLMGRKMPVAPFAFGNQQNLVPISPLYFSEDELATSCEAFKLAEDAALVNYNRIRDIRVNSCPQDTTGTG